VRAIFKDGDVENAGIPFASAKKAFKDNASSLALHRKQYIEQLTQGLQQQKNAFYRPSPL
jgi:hypothetical protein